MSCKVRQTNLFGAPIGNIGALPPWDFDPALAVFAAAMAKRTGQAAYANGAAPIVQGKFDGSGVPDALQFPRGSLIDNQAQLVYANFDPYQGTIVFWWTPEKSRDATQTDDEMLVYISSSHYVKYEHDSNRLRASLGGQASSPAAFSSVAGTTYCIAVSWSCNNTIDGTNYVRWSINDTHTFAASTKPTAVTANANCDVGSQQGTILPANAIIEGLTIFDRVLFDGAYGTSLTWQQGPVDELAAIYAAGAGADPLSVVNFINERFCLPTDADTTTALATTGQAHTKPTAVNNLGRAHDGGYLGGDWCVEGNGNNTQANAGSGATLDDMPNGANGWTYICRLRLDTNQTIRVAYKGDLVNAGWSIAIIAGSLQFRVNGAISDGYLSRDVSNYFDGKWHTWVFAYKDLTAGGDGKPYAAVDGKWFPAGSAISGIYQTDAAHNLYFSSSSFAIPGALGWQEFHNDSTVYTVGTNFIPPLTPPGGGTRIEMWPFNEGTGATAAATVTSPGNDAALTNHTWLATHAQLNSPLIPQSVEFDGTTTYVNCGSDAGLDDLADNEFTITVWVRSSTGTGTIIAKGSAAAQRGWSFALHASLGVLCNINCVTTDAETYLSSSNVLKDRIWHHLTFYFNDAGDRKIYVAVDGIWITGTKTAGVGAIVSDAADNMHIGRRVDSPVSYHTGAIGCVEISNNDRYGHTANFVPPGRVNFPTPDGNTVAQWNFNDGAGATLDNAEGTAARDGTINGTYVWNNTPDATTDEPGVRHLANAINIGANGANDGVSIEVAGLGVRQSLACFVDISIDQSSQARPAIDFYDQDNGNVFTTLEGPSFTGTHTGGNNSPTLIDAAGRFPRYFVGWVVYNIPDGSSATITATSGDETTITAALAGGTDNDWDTNDVYRIMPPSGRNYAQYPWFESFTAELPSIDQVYTIASDCTNLQMRIRNMNAQGVLTIHSTEIFENLVANPSMEYEKQYFAASRTMVQGTEGGSLANAQERDGTDWTITETAAGIEVVVNFNVGAGLDATSFNIYGHYAGNPAHTVNVDAWNYVTTVYDNLGTIPNAGADSLQNFAMVANHTDANGDVQIRIQHQAPFTPGHVLYIDKMWLYIDPWLPNGWIQSGVGVGELSQDTTVFHSGAASLISAAGFSGADYVSTPTVTLATNEYYARGVWALVTSGAPTFDDAGSGPSVRQDGNTATSALNTGGVWLPNREMLRCTSGGSRRPFGLENEGAVCNYDDAFAIRMAAVTLSTVTAANLANSTENGGIRGDGLDQLTQVIPAGALEATQGRVRWRMRPRHGNGSFVSFGNDDAMIAVAFFDVNNRMEIYLRTDTTLRAAIVVGGVNTATTIWTPGGAIAADTGYLLEMRYTNAVFSVLVDGVEVMTAAPGAGIDFGASVPNVFYAGSDEDGYYQCDAVFLAP